jgi:TPR repeat protein
MGPFDLVLRFVPEDERLATRLAAALAVYGYSIRLAPEREVYQGTPWLVIWSRTSVNDDAFLFECTQAARRSGDLRGANDVFEVKSDGVRSWPKLPRIGEDVRHRVGEYWTTDLSGWDGDPANGCLTPLIWEMPRPAAPAADAPIKRAANFNDARWLTARASGNLAYMGEILMNPRLHEAAADDPRIPELRAVGQNPDNWARFGPGALEAAQKGPAALYAWGQKVARFFLVPGVEDQQAVLGNATVLGLCFAVQVTVGNDFKPLLQADHRPKEHFARLAEQGDEEALNWFDYSEHRHLVAPFLERLAAAGNPSAIYLQSREEGISRQRERALLERAAEAGHPKACFFVSRQFSYDDNTKAEVEWLRRGAELGDPMSKSEYAEHLDKGTGVRRDAVAAYALYREMGGNELRLAQMLWDGDGVARNRQAAVSEFFRLAVRDGGLWEPHIHIGDLYSKGLGGLRKDLDEAISWYRDALPSNDLVVKLVAGVRMGRLRVEMNDFDKEHFGDRWCSIDELPADMDEYQQIKRFWTPRP